MFKAMTLTKQDYSNIARCVSLGHGTIEYNKGIETLSVYYCYFETGYREDDYLNGTGAFVVTNIYLSADAESYDNENEMDTENNFNEKDLEMALRF